MLLGVDVGGTFTDAALLDGQRLHTSKVPTTPDDQSLGVMRAIEEVLERAGAEPDRIEGFTHGMTVGTNALLTGSGARTALVATRGFSDLLEIARQNRPSLYHPCRGRPAPAGAARACGSRPPSGSGPRESSRSWARPRSSAWSRRCGRAAPSRSRSACCSRFRTPSTSGGSRRRCAQALPELHVSASHEVLPTFREYERCSTTVIDAYLSPLLGRYLRALADACDRTGVPEPEVMRSSGGTASAAEASRAGAWSVLSGPAGGAVGAGVLARSATSGGDAIGIDMGGTSCDVCVVEGGEVRRSDGREIGGRPIQLPMVDVHTVGAGGGSIAWRDPGGALRVGPRSAGAEPGPACYGRGGTEPTVTDANLLLGYLAPDSSLAGGVELDAEAARAAVGALAGELGLGETETAEGIVRVANQEMVRALRVVTVERGVDPRRFALLPFGGAGPMHAAALAAELEMTTIVCPRASGVLSALGLIAAGRRRDVARTLLLAGAEITSERLAEEVRGLAATAAEGLAGAELEVTYELRYRGQAFELPVPGPARAGSGAPRRGLRPRARGPLRLPRPRGGAGARQRARGGAPTGTRAAPAGRGRRRALRGQPPDALRRRLDRGEGAERRAPGRVRDAGPVRVRAARGDARAAARLERRRRCGGHGHRAARRGEAMSAGPGLDPVTLQVLAGGMHAACEEMGAVLIRSAFSPNITERRDCSTALFDARGELVMQAEHIPVHLGSMPDAVAVIASERHREGELWILNDPYRGGTHLPDVTLISPAFVGGELVGFAASRAHHADIGGDTPAGMPVDSTRLEQEGVVIPPTRVDDEALRELAGRMRNPPQRLADLRAQRAANLTGIRRLRELAERDGLPALRAGMDEILAYAERRTRAALAALPDGEGAAEDAMESLDGDPIPLRVRATIDGETLTLDFEGTAEQIEGNLNCPLSVTRSACFYAVRVVCDPDAPPSAGAWRPVEVRAPEGSLVHARPPGAVAAGNIETSSRIADLVLDALAAFAPVQANGQGTMNNLTLAGGDGEREWTYYETIGGGQGACPDADGPSAVHVAMSNTLNTPVEALETDLPGAACASCRCGAAAAAPGDAAAVRGSCASSRRWRRWPTP